MVLKIQKQHTGYEGVLHGGVLPAVMDEALGRALASARGLEAVRESPQVTVDLGVSYLAGAKLGDEVVIEARVLKVGRTVAFSEATARKRDDGTLLASGRATFAILLADGPPRRSARRAEPPSETGED